MKAVLYTKDNIDIFKLGRRLSDLLKDGTYKRVITLDKKNLDYRVGQLYWCGYCQKAFRVIKKNFTKDEKGNMKFSSVTVEWEDGNVATHMTSLNSYRDFLLFK